MAEPGKLAHWRMWLYLALMLSVSGCAGRAVHDEELLCTAREKAVAVSNWSARPQSVHATVKPLSVVLGEHSMLLQAVYKTEGAENARFILLMPQGSKVGQWARNGREIHIEAVSFPGAKNLVGAAASALDELMRLRPEEKDEWDLRDGDNLGSIPSGQKILRRRALRNGKRCIVLADPASGHPVAAYCYAGDIFAKRPLVWKMEFSENPLRFCFKQYESAQSVDVLITAIHE